MKRVTKAEAVVLAMAELCQERNVESHVWLSKETQTKEE